MKFRSKIARSSTYRGMKRAGVILAAARTVFAQHGAAGFTTRRIAKEAKLSLSSVQHVFPTIDALLLSMLEDVCMGYDGVYHKLLASLPFDPKARWDAVIEFLIDDIAEPSSRSLFFGFFALSCTNKGAGRLLQEAYAYHVNYLARFIFDLRPELSQESCRLLAVQVAALIEGVMLFSAPGSKIISRRSLRESTLDSISRLIAGAA
jgi:AcrR family transcriptional regulator